MRPKSDDFVPFTVNPCVAQYLVDVIKLHAGAGGPLCNELVRIMVLFGQNLAIQFLQHLAKLSAEWTNLYRGLMYCDS